MLEVTILSLLSGNLGWQAVVVSLWLRSHERLTRQHHYQEEEDEILTCFDSKEDSALVKPRPSNSQLERSNSPDLPQSDPQLVGWEFKIVRANRDLFYKPAVFQRLCEEEALAGWILLEKLDDRRVRFKRLIALRNVIDPQQLPHDPYRCHYGSPWTPLAWLGAIAVLIAIAVPSYFSYSLVSKMLAHSQEPAPVSPYQNVPPQDFPPTP